MYNACDLALRLQLFLSLPYQVKMLAVYGENDPMRWVEQ